MGLDYGYAHLVGDPDRLMNSEVEAGYLVHLQRTGRHIDADSKDLIRQPGVNIKAAYAHHGLKQGTINGKRIAEADIRGPVDRDHWLSDGGFVGRCRSRPV